MPAQKRQSRFHGRIEAEGRLCAWPECEEAGEYRAPLSTGGGMGDEPGHWRYLCLEHVRQFNAGYNFFAGMSSEEIYEAQHPVRGYDSRRRVYEAGVGAPPAWADFSDPLDAIAARFKHGIHRPAPADPRLDAQDRKALKVLGLGEEADRNAIRKRYSELVRRYHPDRNGGDRTHENRLAKVISAYTHLRKAAAFQ